jgi:hypothetical protein
MLAQIQRKNVRALMDHWGLSIADLGRLSGLKRSGLSQAFGDVKKESAISDESLMAIGNAFKIWSGLLNQRDFCPKKTSRPHQSLTLTLDLQNLSQAQANQLDKLIGSLKDLVVVDANE